MHPDPGSTHHRAPAKLNLGLRVLGRRADGYHLLESLFVPLDLADQVRVRFRDEKVLRAGGSSRIDLSLGWESGAEPDFDVPTGEGNIAYRAAREFLQRAGIHASIEIALTKVIPSGAGLGGGSSDAGAVLRALRERYPDALSPGALSGLALELGADVPFFLDSGAAHVAGIGEKITRIAGFPGLGLLLVNPGVSLATAEVFRIYDSLEPSLTPAEPGSTMRALESLVSGSKAPEMSLEWSPRSSLEGLSKGFDAGLLVNDLEASACELCPAVGRLRRRLDDLGARWTGMSGSGATVYGIFADEFEAKVALERGRFESPIWARATRTQ